MSLFWTILKLSIKNLRVNKMRSFLTVLGIQIGVGAVIALMAIGYGTRESMTEMIRGFGANLIYLAPNYRSSSGVRLNVVERLTIEDCQALIQQIPELAAVSPQISQQSQIKAGGINQRANVTGVSRPFLKIMNHPLKEGRTFTNLEEERARKVVIIGDNIVQELFGGRHDRAVGDQIKINGTQYKIVGALDAKGGMGESPDKQLYVPYSTAMKRMVGTKYLHSIVILVRDESESERAVQEITRVMRRRHRIQPDKEDDFQIFSMQDALSSMRSATLIFTILLSGIAGISLLVGGIGIMNIMLVTVTERTREIGIRKALGAKRRDILVQFLIESVVISLVGGTFGIAFGALLAQGADFAAVLAAANNPDADFAFHTVISGVSVAVALGFCMFIGLFFGIYPARRASRLSPIDALRHE